MPTPADETEPTSAATPVTLYWRPACGFCASLLGGIDRLGLHLDEVNIWETPDAAATVRRFANGNETVPTVVIGDPDSDTAVGLVNPSVGQLVDALERLAPDVLNANG